MFDTDLLEIQNITEQINKIHAQFLKDFVNEQYIILIYKITVNIKSYQIIRTPVFKATLMLDKPDIAVYLPFIYAGIKIEIENLNKAV